MALLRQARRVGLIDGPQHGPVPRVGDLEGIGAERLLIVGCGEHQTGHRQRRRGVLGGRSGDRRKRCGCGLDSVTGCRRGEHRRRTTESVPGQAQLLRTHADVSRAQAHTADHVQGGAEVSGQSEHRGRQSALGVRRGRDDAPTGQVFTGAGVVRGIGEPVMTEGHPGKAEARSRCVDDARDTGKRQVTAQNPVRTAPGQGGEGLARPGHLTTVADRTGGVGRTILVPRVRNRGVCGAPARPRCSDRRTAPDGVPGL